MKTKALFIFIFLLLSGCTLVITQPTDADPTKAPTPEPTMSTLPNPASAYCGKQGYNLEIRTATDGSQTVICHFPDGSECEEWAYYRGECTPASQGGSLPNPASVFCEQQGYSLEIRTSSDGSQAGFCVFADGSECEEWAYFRGECKPTSNDETSGSTQDSSLEWKIFTNELLGYSFAYPASAEIITNDEPLKSISISGVALNGETWSIAHPGDREEFRPPESADLLQWLTDHYLVGENRQPDELIAGLTAIHYRHERSPQSYADDRYFFARGGQLYQILIGHSEQAEDWELNNRFLHSFQFIEPTPQAGIPTPIPTAMPIDPTAYQDWMTYTHPVYNFTLRLPDDWSVEEVNQAGPGMGGHLLNLHPVDEVNKENIRLTFRSQGDEEVLLWPTGVGQGEFIANGTLDIDSQPVQRQLLVCPSGEVTSIWYQEAEGQPNILRGDVEFGFIFTATPTHCEAGYSLSGKTQLMGEMIIASLHVP